MLLQAVIIMRLQLFNQPGLLLGTNPFAARFALSSYRLTQRLTVFKLTSSSRAMPILLLPACHLLMTRSRKSTEYARIVQHLKFCSREFTIRSIFLKSAVGAYLFLRQ